MQKTFSSLKNKIVKRYTLNDENLKDYKSTNINILLNRVRVNKKKEFQKKIFIYCSNFIRGCFIWCINILNLNLILF
jgi:hypothetical protein